MHPGNWKAWISLAKSAFKVTLVASTMNCLGQISSHKVNADLSVRSIDGHTLDSPYTVPPGMHPAKVIPLAKQFQYPEFREGRIYLSTGKHSDIERMNYHLLYDAIQLIGPKGDTVWLDKTLVEYAQIGSDVYFCDLKTGYYRLLTKDQRLKLMIKSMWIVAQKRPLHAHWSAIESPQKTSRVDDFIFPSEYVTFVKTGYYVFLGPRNKIYQPTRQALIKVFPEQKKVIKEYIKEQKINFSDDEDVKNIVDFCSSLSIKSDSQ